MHRSGDTRNLENDSSSIRNHDRRPKAQGPQFPVASHTFCSNDASQLWSTSTLVGCLRPRLNYEYWVDVLPKPPVTLMPFIGAARYTFRGHLYWACTEYLLALCRLVTMPHSPPVWFTCQSGTYPTPQEAERLVWTHIQHSPPVPSVRALQDMAEEQKGYSVLDYEHSDSEVCDEELPNARPSCRLAGLERQGDPSIWMTITELEIHVRQQLGSDAFSRLERTIDHCCIIQSSKAANEELMTVVRLLMKNLAESFICFGNGPQWRKEAVSTLFQDAMRA
ncbi:hypothetical protein NPX13_g9890 [Xylaria arbuscula]|uniref:Uncharacterized protein n=1 Tax=Xylaria arbuscula TaxID=114810 RepID=A0A9W8TH28_9PEZI|nr:hypothetical protein NPX13_g9890 [Xylaria arbuscula]